MENNKCSCINSLACDILRKCVIEASKELYLFGTKRRKKYLSRIKMAGNDTEDVIKNISCLIQKQEINNDVYPIQLTKFEKLCIQSLNKK